MPEQAVGPVREKGCARAWLRGRRLPSLCKAQRDPQYPPKERETVRFLTRMGQASPPTSAGLQSGAATVPVLPASFPRRQVLLWGPDPQPAVQGDRGRRWWWLMQRGSKLELRLVFTFRSFNDIKTITVTVWDECC